MACFLVFSMFSIIELLQFTIVRSFWASLGKLFFGKCAIKMQLREERLIIALGQTDFRGALQLGQNFKIYELDV